MLMEDLNKVYDVLWKHYEFKEFREGQREVIEKILSKRDVFACMATGSGKSLCYQLPGLILDGIVVVVSPMISLQKDQVASLLKKNISAVYINSETQNVHEIKNDIYENKYKFLYISPEKMLTDEMKVFLPLLKISYVAIDECHCISQWGHDFRPSYMSIGSIRKIVPNVQLLAFTATATTAVCKDVIQSLELSDPFVYIGNADRRNLKYLVLNKHKNGELQLTSLIKRELKMQPSNTIVIYVYKKSTIKQLYEFLIQQNVSVCCYHGDLSTEERQTSYELFMNSKVDVILATVAFGMGIDKPNVRMVIHYDAPSTIEGYLQETGRAGRDGADSQCILLFSESETKKRFYVLHEHQTGMLKSFISYAKTSECRRLYLNRFISGATSHCNSNLCDNCEKGKRNNNETMRET